MKSTATARKGQQQRQRQPRSARAKAIAAFDRDKFLREDWPNALESGEFQQGKGKLVRHRTKADEEYCCLGVACKLLSQAGLLPKTTWKDDAFLPPQAVALLGISPEGAYKDPKSGKETDLAQDNDNGKTFTEIAKIIRRLVDSKTVGFIAPDAVDSRW